jgi:hypothetical protein
VLGGLLVEVGELRVPVRVDLAFKGFRVRGAFAYVTGTTAAGETLLLMRLRSGGSATRWGFAIYLASKDGYTTPSYPPASPPAPPRTPWTPPAASTWATQRAGSEPPTNLRAGPLRTVPPAPVRCESRGLGRCPATTTLGAEGPSAWSMSLSWLSYWLLLP